MGREVRGARVTFTLTTPDEVLAAATTAWPDALKAALHPDAREHRKDAPDGKQHVHPSDPPHDFKQWARGVVKPGPLPALLAEPVAGVRREEWTGHFRTPELTDALTLKMGLEGQARHFVVEARRKQATALVVGGVKVEGELLYVTVVVMMRSADNT